MVIKQFVRSLLRRVGLDVRRFRPAASEEARLMAMLAEHEIDLIFDVGANTGQFGKMLRALGYAQRIVSFEPLSAARERLMLAAKRDPLWHVAEQVAIGAESGEVELHIAGNSVSSSVLGMLDAHSRAAPESAYVGSQRVPLRKLDDAAMGFVNPDSKLFLKIDTQGYEDRVLAGAPELLRRAVGVQLELSLVPLYDGQRQFDELYLALKGMGFSLWNMTPAFVDPKNGRLLQLDATLFRRT